MQAQQSFGSETQAQTSLLCGFRGYDLEVFWWAARVSIPAPWD